jgi:hypothetical protein
MVAPAYGGIMQPNYTVAPQIIAQPMIAPPMIAPMPMYGGVMPMYGGYGGGYRGGRRFYTVNQ